jgi:ParB family transcriptional regulator, chromosome partitioning protein
MSNIKKQALGRGLSALLENSKTDITTKVQGENAPVANSVSVIQISQIETNPFQPRTHFEEVALQELANSIKQHGIIQPMTVRKLGYDKYQLISGERRYRASQIAGLKEVPVYIRVANDQSVLEMALVENIQREDLDAIEISLSYKRLIEECNLTQEQLADKVAKQRSTVTNYLRLLKLPAQIQLGIRDGLISMGHARALINIEQPNTQLEIYQQVVDHELSVRATEELARGEKLMAATALKGKKTITAPAKANLSFEDKKLENDLNDIFHNNVVLKKKDKNKGTIAIAFNNENELQHILSFFSL